MNKRYVLLSLVCSGMITSHLHSMEFSVGASTSMVIGGGIGALVLCDKSDRADGAQKASTAVLGAIIGAGFGYGCYYLYSRSDKWALERDRERVQIIQVRFGSIFELFAQQNMPAMYKQIRNFSVNEIGITPYPLVTFANRVRDAHQMLVAIAQRHNVASESTEWYWQPSDTLLFGSVLPALIDQLGQILEFLFNNSPEFQQELQAYGPEYTGQLNREHDAAVNAANRKAQIMAAVINANAQAKAAANIADATARAHMQGH